MKFYIFEGIDYKTNFKVKVAFNTAVEMAIRPMNEKQSVIKTVLGEITIDLPFDELLKKLED